MNFSNVITEIPAARLTSPSMCAMCLKWDVLKKKPIVAIPLPKQEKKKNFCGNAIAEIGEEKKNGGC